MVTILHSLRAWHMRSPPTHATKTSNSENKFWPPAENSPPPKAILDFLNIQLIDFSSQILKEKIAEAGELFFWQTSSYPRRTASSHRSFLPPPFFLQCLSLLYRIDVVWTRRSPKESALWLFQSEIGLEQPATHRQLWSKTPLRRLLILLAVFDVQRLENTESVTKY